MKKWQLPEAKKNLEKIIDQVLQSLKFKSLDNSASNASMVARTVAWFWSFW